MFVDEHAITPNEENLLRSQAFEGRPRLGLSERATAGQAKKLGQCIFFL